MVEVVNSSTSDYVEMEMHSGFSVGGQSELTQALQLVIHSLVINKTLEHKASEEPVKAGVVPGEEPNSLLDLAVDCPQVDLALQDLSDAAVRNDAVQQQRQQHQQLPAFPSYRRLPSKGTSMSSLACLLQCKPALGERPSNVCARAAMWLVLQMKRLGVGESREMVKLLVHHFEDSRDGHHPIINFTLPTEEVEYAGTSLLHLIILQQDIQLLRFCLEHK
jgi:hypothetical protein